MPCRTQCLVALGALLLAAPWSCPGAAPAEPKGISLTVTLARTVVQPGEEFAFTVTLKNVSGADMRIYRTNADDYRMVDAANGTVWVTQANLFPPPPSAPPLLSTFKAGQEWTHTVTLGPRTKFGHPDAKPETAQEGLPTGRYRFEYSTTFMNHYPEKGAVWTGTLGVKPLEFEIGGKKR